jgi:ribosome-binding protein aMBF1 (putative translation factor)
MTITIDPKTDTVTMTRAEYEALVEAAEDAEDRAHLAAQEKGERLLGTEAVRADALPVELVERMLDGESPVRIWREHRGLTLGDLADRAGIAPSYVSEIETGRKPGSVAALTKLARVLGIDLDDLVP